MLLILLRNQILSIMKRNNYRKIAFISILIFTIAASRLVPHWPNFTAVAAIALFGGAMFTRKFLAFLVPLTAMFITDLILGFSAMMPAVYISFALMVVIGFGLQTKRKFLPITIGAIGATILFFLITNFASWLAMPIYPKTALGLAQAYMAGLAFFNDGAAGISPFVNSLAGNLFYTWVIFGIVAVAEAKIPTLAPVKITTR